MFGLFKKKVNAEQFGANLVPYVSEILYGDADRAFASCFADFDLSRGSSAFFNSVGVNRETMTMNRYFHMHCSIQGACTIFDQRQRHAITIGAMSQFKKIDGYNAFDGVQFLEHVYDETAKWTKGLDHLDNPEATAHWLPAGFNDAAIKGSRFILNLVIKNSIAPHEITADVFRSHSRILLTSIAMVNRAIQSMQSKYRLI
jgi:hypothetical protein